MSVSRKYGRTFHYPFSPGTTSDDRINTDYWQQISALKTVIHTEKLDGENNCLSRYGVFARSHAAPTVSPWTRSIREKWKLLKNDLGDYEIFGENLFAIHSIAYRQLDAHYFVFGVRELDRWLSWDETAFIAAMFDLPLVPVIQVVNKIENKTAFERQVLELAGQRSIYDSVDAATQKPCSREGIVTRDIMDYSLEAFPQRVFKYVRKGHVTTDEHWTRNWKRAPLKTERKWEL